MSLRLPLSLILALATLCAAQPSPAIEVVGDHPAYLDAKLRPRWRLIDLEAALSEIATLIEKPVSSSEGVQEFAAPIVLMEEGTLTVRETLELLERSQDLHFRVEPLRIAAMTGVEFRREGRRLVNVNLRDYGLFFAPRDFSQAKVGYDKRMTSENNWQFGSESPEEVLEQILNVTMSRPGLVDETESPPPMRGSGNIWLRATAAEEVSLRHELQAISDLGHRRIHWRLHFGYLPESSLAKGGIIGVADLRRLAQELEQPVVLDLSGESGQQISASALDHEAIIAEGDINQTGMHPVLSPQIMDVVMGKTARIRAFRGLDHTLIEFHLGWAEREGTPRVHKIRRPSRLPGTTTLLRQDESNSGAKSTTTSVDTNPPTVDAGLEFEIVHQPLWIWEPEGELFLSEEQGFVLIGSQGERRVAVLIEEVRR